MCFQATHEGDECLRHSDTGRKTVPGTDAATTNASILLQSAGSGDVVLEARRCLEAKFYGLGLKDPGHGLGVLSCINNF